jgi:hypothetical protein
MNTIAAILIVPFLIIAVLGFIKSVCGVLESLVEVSMKIFKFIVK